MKIFILWVLGIIIYLLIGVIISLIVYVLYTKKKKNYSYSDDEMIIIFWPIFLIGVLLVMIISIPITLYEKIIEKIDKAYEEEEEEI